MLWLVGLICLCNIRSSGAQAQQCASHQHCAALYARAIGYLDAGQHAAAEQNLRSAISLQPADEEVATGLAVVLMQARQDEAAVASLQRVLDINPKAYRALISLGQLHKRRAPRLQGAWLRVR